MKRNLTMAFLWGLFVMFCACGCSEKGYNIEQKKNKISIILNAEAHTQMGRVAISGNKTEGYTTCWEVGDKLGAIVVQSGEEAENVGLALTAQSIAEDGCATFTGTTDVNNEGLSPILFYTYYPLLADSPQVTVQGVAGQIPSEQTMTAEGSYDPTAAWMVGQAKEMNLQTGTQPMEFNTKFRHLNCFVNLSCRAVTHTEVSQDDVVRSVQLRAEGKTLSGEFALDVATGQCVFSAPKDYVCVEVPSGVTLGELSAWLVINPFELGVDDALVVEVSTDGYIISKRITGRKMLFAERNVVTLNLAVDENCTVTPNVAAERSVVYSVAGKQMVSASGAIPDGVTESFLQSGNTPGQLAKYGTAELTLSDLGAYAVSGISVSVKAGSSSAAAKYEVRMAGVKCAEGVIRGSVCGTSSYTPIVIYAPSEFSVADNLSVTLQSTSGKFYLESFTINYTLAQ